MYYLKYKILLINFFSKNKHHKIKIAYEFKNNKQKYRYGATVELSGIGCGGGFFMKNLSGSNKIKALDDASNAFFGKNTKSYGDGGSIPFLKLLGEMFESAEIIAIGVAGYECNQHLPNEFLNLSYAKEFICVLSHALVGFVPA